MEEKNLIGIRIRQAREELDLTQEQLAERLGVTFQSLQQWESGKTTPRQHRMRKLANILGKTPSWIQFGVGPEELNSSADVFSYLRSEEFKTQICAAHASAMKQCIQLNWLSMKRSDIPLSVLADLFYAKLLDEYGVTANYESGESNDGSQVKEA